VGCYGQPGRQTLAVTGTLNIMGISPAEPALMACDSGPE